MEAKLFDQIADLYCNGVQDGMAPDRCRDPVAAQELVKRGLAENVGIAFPRIRLTRAGVNAFFDEEVG